MTFGEKLCKLRKDHGFSKAALAEQLHTTRQAISKWENGQGYPEMESVLIMGSLFEVSIDDLLKKTEQTFQGNDQGLYVSQEMARGYLMNRHRFGKYMATGFFFLALAFMPCFLFDQHPAAYVIPALIIAVIGIGIITFAYLMEEDLYKNLTQGPLLFDEQYLQWLRKQYKHVKKKYTLFLLFGSFLFLLGFSPIIFEQSELTSGFYKPYYAICIVFIAAGTYIWTRFGTLLNAYKLLASNDEHTSQLVFKIKQKVRKKIDDF